MGSKKYIVTDNHLEPPLEKVNKEAVFRNPTVRTLLNKSTLRTLPHLEPSLTIIYNIYIFICIYIYVIWRHKSIYIYICTMLGVWGRGTIKMLNTHQILYIYTYIYIYIRNRTVRTPPTINVFSKNEIFISINLCRGTIKMLNTHQILYIYETAQLEPPPPSTFFPKSMPGHHQDAEYSPNPIYIYETAQLEPPHHQRFFQNQ